MEPKSTPTYGLGNTTPTDCVAMSKSLYEIGRAGLYQFIDALEEVISEDMTLTQEQAGEVPFELTVAEGKLLAAWDDICGRKKGERDGVKE